MRFKITEEQVVLEYSTNSIEYSTNVKSWCECCQQTYDFET